MREMLFPTVAKIKAWALGVTAHSRGGTGTGGHYSYERGPGARVTGSLELAPLCTADALRMRAFLHSQRGKSGTFVMPAINRALAENPCDEELTQFTDCTGFDDGTTFMDAWTGTLAGALSGAVGADAETLTVDSATGLAIGDWFLVGGQLVRITGISGAVLTIRPRLRATISSGTAWSAGPVYAEFRTLDDAPVIPLIPGRSREFSIDIEEAY